MDGCLLAPGNIEDLDRRRGLKAISHGSMGERNHNPLNSNNGAGEQITG